MATALRITAPDCCRLEIQLRSGVPNVNISERVLVRLGLRPADMPKKHTRSWSSSLPLHLGVEALRDCRGDSLQTPDPALPYLTSLLHLAASPRTSCSSFTWQQAHEPCHCQCTKSFAEPAPTVRIRQPSSLLPRAQGFGLTGRLLSGTFFLDLRLLFVSANWKLRGTPFGPATCTSRWPGCRSRALVSA